MKTTINGLGHEFTDEGTGPAVMLLHGYPLDRRMWRGLIEPLRGTYRVIAPDMRGMGGSEASLADISIDRYADDAVALLDALGVEKAAVAGFSMGGYVLMALLRKAPERLSAAMFVNTRAEADTREGQRSRLQAAAAVLERGAAAASEAMLGKLLAPQTYDERSALVEEVRGWMDAANPLGLVHASLAMAFRPDASSELSRLQMPALVIGGEHDGIMPPSVTAQLAARVNARHVVIPGAGHLTPVEAPATVSDAISEFLASVGRF